MAHDSSADLRVLIIEDNRGDAHLVKRALREGEVTIPPDVAESLAEARELVEQHEYDVMLLDLGLPDGRGPAAVLAAREFAPETPIVVLTGQGAPEALAGALAADADDFLSKAELVSVALMRAIRHACQRRQMTLLAREHQRRLQVSEERLQTVLSAVSDGIVVVDADNRVLFANDAFCRLVGVDPDTVIGETFRELAALDEGIVRLQMRDVVADSAPREVEVASVPIVWDDVSARVATLRDITDRRQVEARLNAAQRMEAVGQLAGGMAHEINNVLAVVLANVGILMELVPDEGALDLAQEIEISARRGTSLLKRLLAVGRRQRLHVGTLDLAHVVGGLGDTLSRLMPPDISLDVQVPTEPALARGDTAAIEQILLNLVNNARDAMPDGGRVSVEVAEDDVTEEFSRDHRGLDSGRHVRLTVRDSGTGMDPVTLEKAFEPFFSTKSRGRGTGLGLSTVYGLTKQLGGSVYLRPGEDGGTVADVYFPLVEGERPREQPPRSDTRPAGGGDETILLVEDEDALRRTACRVLRRFGYTVLEARNGIEALSALEEARDRVDMVLTDVIMPEMGGRALYEAIRHLPGRPPVLFVSGYSAEDLVDGDLLDPSFDLLAKPWSVEDLLAGVRRAIASRESGLVEVGSGIQY